jgi:polyhydroxyalkanoate synthesis regulator phasin
MASSQPELTDAPLTRAEKETQTEAARLNTQIEHALAAVTVRSRNDIEELEACADRLERAARDLSVALREMARERRTARDDEEAG